MKTISRWVTHRPDKRLAASVPHIGELVRIPHNLVEYRNEVYRMRARA